MLLCLSGVTSGFLRCVFGVWRQQFFFFFLKCLNRTGCNKKKIIKKLKVCTTTEELVIKALLHCWSKNSKWSCLERHRKCCTGLNETITLCLTAGQIMTICFIITWCLLIVKWKTFTSEDPAAQKHTLISSRIKGTVTALGSFCFSSLPYNREWLLHILFNNGAPANAWKWEVNCSVNCIYLTCGSGL